MQKWGSPLTLGNKVQFGPEVVVDRFIGYQPIMARSTGAKI